MTSNDSKRSEDYAVAANYVSPARIVDEPGFGAHGNIFATSENNIIKVFAQNRPYATEKKIYQYFQDRDIKDLYGLNVPALVSYSDELLLIEMTAVQKPYILDFAECDLGKCRYPQEQIHEFVQQMVERFDERAMDAESIFYRLVRQHKIYYWDLKPGNLELPPR